MLDVARSQGVAVDAERLSRQLGVPVVPIQANKGIGIDRLREVVAATAGAAPPAKTASFPEAFETEARALHRTVGEDVPLFLVRRLVLDVGGYTEQRLAARCGPCVEAVRQARARLAAAGCAVPAVEARSRYARIREVTAGCVTRPAQRPVTGTDRLDRVLTHKVWGTVAFLVVMALVFQAIFTWARPLMKLIGDGKDFLAGWLRESLPPGPFTGLLTDGVVEGVGSVVVFLPQILILFAFIALLEDCGYMARAAFLMDRVMSRAGLSGKSFIPMLSSVACAVPGIMATRVIEDRRDRLATILVAPLMSCSARLPVYILLIGTFLSAGFPLWLPGLVMFVMYTLGMVLAPLVAWALKSTLLRGETPVFVMEMPPYKWPSLRQTLRRMFDSGWAFVRRAGTLILASMVLVWALLYFPAGHPEGGTYPERIATLEAKIKEPARELEDLKEKGGDEARLKELTEEVEPIQSQINALQAEWKRHSLLGRAGRALEPAVRPLGWDWRIGVAALASFPAREVVVGTLGIVFQVGKVETEAIQEAEKPAETELGRALQAANWDDDPSRKLFTVPTALSLMVFFALCCQCASTLAIIRRETRTWRWPLFTFTYMTVLAYIAALVVYQVGRLFS
jgi:ferrous iron transport protein B